jgi:hypothetical protein
MSTSPQTDTQKLWLAVYAFRSFTHVSHVCRYILDFDFDVNHPVYYPLIASIYVIYGRPFKLSYGVGKLEDDFVPPHLLAEHKHTLKLRDTFYAHIDGQAPPTMSEPTNKVLVISDGSSLQLGLNEMKPLPSKIPALLSLSEALREKTHSEVETLKQRVFAGRTVAQGRYFLNPDPAASDLLISIPPNEWI